MSTDDRDINRDDASTHGVESSRSDDAHAETTQLPVDFASPAYDDHAIPGYPANTYDSAAMVAAYGTAGMDAPTVGAGQKRATGAMDPHHPGTVFPTPQGSTRGRTPRRLSISMLLLGLCVLGAAIAGTVSTPGSGVAYLLVFLAPAVLILSLVVLLRLRRPVSFPHRHR